MATRKNLIAGLVLTLSAFGVASPRADAAGCEGRSYCSEVSTFVAQLTDFRTSVQGSNRYLIATVNFANKTDRPLIIGYVSGSGVGLDEHGNRYTISGSDKIRGIGEIRGNTFDSRFTLQPGERADARFELGWYAGKQIAGVQFALDLAVREIDAVTGNQFRLGREHSLRFTGLSNGVSASSAAVGASAGVATAAPPAVGSAPVPATASAVAPAANPCEGRARCYAAGPFLGEVTQVSAGKEGNNHLVQVRVQFRNLSNQPVILAYQERSGSMLDNYGQKYTVDGRYTQDVSGIGQVSRNKADPQFVLSPGEARSATFTYRRYIGKTAVGTVFSPDFVIEQLEILPSQQVRSVREYSVSYNGLVVGMTAAAGDPGEALRQLGDGLRSIFKKKN
jgi:hypothetical protein